jgi:hypothetical protein
MLKYLKENSVNSFTWLQKTNLIKRIKFGYIILYNLILISKRKHTVSSHEVHLPIVLGHNSLFALRSNCNS